MRLSQENGIVFGFKPADHNAAGISADSVDTGKFSHIAYLLQFGELTGDAILTVKSGATDGVETTSETFYYRLAAAIQGATGADVYASETGVTTLTLTAATYENKELIVEVPVDELTADQPFLTLTLSNAATELFASCAIVCLGMRHVSETPQTVIA